MKKPGITEGSLTNNKPNTTIAGNGVKTVMVRIATLIPYPRNSAQERRRGGAAPLVGRRRNGGRFGLAGALFSIS